MVRLEVTGCFSHFWIWESARCCKCKYKPEKGRRLHKHYSNRKRFPSLGAQGLPGQCYPRQAGRSVGTFPVPGSSSHLPHSIGAYNLLEDSTVCYWKRRCSSNNNQKIASSFPLAISTQLEGVKTAETKREKKCHPQYMAYYALLDYFKKA